MILDPEARAFFYSYKTFPIYFSTWYHWPTTAPMALRADESYNNCTFRNIHQPKN